MPPGDRQAIEAYERGESRKLHDPVTGRYLPKLTDEVTVEVCRRLRGGASIRAAAEGAGVSEGAVMRWLKEGRQRTGNPDYERFANDVDQALADIELSIVGTVYQRGLEGDTKALMFLLERKFPSEYGRSTRVEHANPEGEVFRTQAFPMLDTSKLTDEELDSLIALHEKGKPDGTQPVAVDAAARGR